MDETFYKSIITTLQKVIEEKDLLITELQAKLKQYEETKPKQEPKDKNKLTYTDVILSIFKEEKYEPNQEISVDENFDKLAALNEITYIIRNDAAKNRKIFYRTSIQHEQEKEFILVNKKEFRIAKVQDNNLNKTTYNGATHYDIQNTKDLGLDLTYLNKLFKINSNGIDHATNTLISKSITNQFTALTDLEHEINANCVRGQPCYLKHNNLLVEDAYSFDMNSHFPSLLVDEKFIFPIRSHSQEKTITEITDTNKLAIYVLNVDYNDFKAKLPHFVQLKDFTNENKHKIFYTNYMVKLFNELNIKYSLHSESVVGFNCIEYDDNNTRNGKEMFSETINKLYDNSKDITCKAVLKRFHGNMFQYEKVFSDLITESSEIKMNTDYKTITTKTNDGMKFNTGRMKLFFFDYLKYHMYHNHIKDKPEILKIRTDSILYNSNDLEYLESILPISSKLGDFKYEAVYYNIIIKDSTVSFKNYTESTDESGVAYYNPESGDFEF